MWGQPTAASEVLQPLRDKTRAPSTDAAEGVGMTRPKDLRSVTSTSVSWVAILVGLAFMLLFVIGFVYWFIIRIEVNAGQILVLMNKTGRELSPELGPFSDQVVLYPELTRTIATKTGGSDEY